MPVLQIMYEHYYHEHYYHEQLPKISPCLKYSIDAYHKHILPLCFGKVNSRDNHGDFLSVMFPRFPNCFLPFPLVFPPVFLRFPSVFLLFPCSISLVSCFKFVVILKHNKVTCVFYKHIKIQGLGSDILKATQNIG